MKIPIRQCPWCGSTQFVLGYQNFEVMVMTTPNGVFGNKMRHLICKRCGVVLLSRVAAPQGYKNVGGE